MKTEERIQKQRELIEEVGLYFDKQGFQPIAGRVLGLLMVMDKEEYTFDEIVEELEISKSSASVALKNLEIRGNVEYITRPGDRKRYFRIRAMEPMALIDDFAGKMEMFKSVRSRILDLKADKDSRGAKFISNLDQMIEFFLKNIDEIKKAYFDNNNDSFSSK